MKLKPTYHILTFGCQMNKNDSARVESIFQSMKFVQSRRPEDADVVLMNSCSVRQRAEDRIYGLARRFARLKKDNPKMVLCVTGCMPGRDKGDVMRDKLPEIDLFFPTKDMVHLPRWLSELNPAFRNMVDLDDDYLALHPTYHHESQSFVTIQTGCNHFCTYCVVPFARGLETNRSLKQILDEVHVLVDGGCVEITLLGQIVNHYIAPDPQFFSLSNPYTKSDFAKLLWEIQQIDGVQRLHWTAPHPIFMTEEVIDALTLPCQLNFLHLPVQSGNNEVLKRMNRRHTREFYIDLIDTIRQRVPDIAIGTDIIVGFAGETRSQFQDTVSLFKACDFDISYTAQYSERSGTLGAKMFRDDVSTQEKKRRWHELQGVMEQIVLRKNQQYVDMVVSVLVDSVDAGWCMGNSREMKRVRFKGDASHMGKVVSAQVYKAQEWMLHARPVVSP